MWRPKSLDGSADSIASHTQVTMYQRLPCCYWRRVSERRYGTPQTRNCDWISMGLELYAPVTDLTMCMFDRNWENKWDKTSFWSSFEVPEWNKKTPKPYIFFTDWIFSFGAVYEKWHLENSLRNKTKMLYILLNHLPCGSSGGNCLCRFCHFSNCNNVNRFLKQKEQRV